MITMYTDGSAKGNGEKHNCGGWGLVVMRDGAIIKLDAQLCFNTTNNREEIKAVLKAFELAQTKYQDEECIIYSDSSYVVNICNDWIYKWASNNWLNSKKQIVENLDLVQQLYKYLTIDFFNCQVVKCAGHANILGNELADALATNQLVKIEQLKSQMPCSEEIVEHKFAFLENI